MRVAVEAALANKDAGFVLPSQAVEIKVEAFPFMRYGIIPGRVAVVSSDAGQTPDADPTRPTATGVGRTWQPADMQGPVYSVRVKLLADSIRIGERAVALTPGMAVTAEIKTGKRRLIEYVLDPVKQRWGGSLRER